MRVTIKYSMAVEEGMRRFFFFPLLSSLCLRQPPRDPQPGGLAAGRAQRRRRARSECGESPPRAPAAAGPPPPRTRPAPRTRGKCRSPPRLPSPPAKRAHAETAAQVARRRCAKLQPPAACCPPAGAGPPGLGGVRVGGCRAPADSGVRGMGLPLLPLPLGLGGVARGHCVCVCVCVQGRACTGVLLPPGSPPGGDSADPPAAPGSTRGTRHLPAAPAPAMCRGVPLHLVGGARRGGVPRLPFGLGAFPCLALGPQSLCRAVMSAAALPAPAGAIRVCGWGKDRYQQQSHLPPAFVSRPLPCVMASPPDPLAGLLLPVRKLLGEMGRKQVFFLGGALTAVGSLWRHKGQLPTVPPWKRLGLDPKACESGPKAALVG